MYFGGAGITAPWERDNEKLIGIRDVRRDERVGHLQIGKHALGLVGRWAIGEAGDARGRERDAFAQPHRLLFVGADELQRRIVLETVEVFLRQRRACRKLRPLEIDGVIVAAQGELPLLVDLGPAAGLDEIGPRDLAFDRPAVVLVGPLVESAAQVDLGIDVEFCLILEALEAAGVAARKEAIEHGAGRVHLELVIARLVVGRLEEQFKDIVKPEKTVVFFDSGVEIGVLHVGQKIEIFAIPEELRFGLRLGGPRLVAEPGEPEVVDRLRVLPGRIGPLAGDLDRRVGEAALECGRRFLWFGRLAFGGVPGERRQDEGKGNGEDARVSRGHGCSSHNRGSRFRGERVSVTESRGESRKKLP